MRGRHAAVFAALFFAALALRPQIVGVGPLIPEIQDDLDTSHALVGLLGTIPVLCMGLFAPLGAYLGGRIGSRTAMSTALALIAVFGVLRAVVPSAWLVVLLTLGVGVGMGLGNSVAPIAVRERVHDRPATGTGVYTTGIQVGSTISAAVAVPIAAAVGGWRAALVAFSLVTFALLVGWMLLTRGGDPHTPAGFPHPPVRSGTAWLLVCVFACMGSAYYGLNAWLPDAYAERGWSDESAGLLLAMMNLTAIPTSFLIPWQSDRRGSSRRPWLILLSTVFLIGAVGLVAAPGLAYGWALLSGVAQGGMFALVMTLPLDFERDRARVGGLVAMMLGLGYTIAAVSPFLLGAVRDATGSFDAVLWTAVAFLVGLVIAVVSLPRSRFAR